MAMTGVLLAVNVYTALALDPVAAYMWTLAVAIGVAVSSSSIAAYLLHRMRKDWRQDYLYKPSGPFFIYCALACSRLAYLLGIDVIIDKLFDSSRCTSQAALVHFFDLYALFALVSVLWSTTSDAVTVMVEYPSVDVKSAHLEQLMRLATGGALGIDVDPVALGELKQIVPKMADRTDQADAEDALKLAKLEERDAKQKEKYFKENEKFFKSAEKRRKKMRQKELAERRKRGENVPDEPSTASEGDGEEPKEPGRLGKLFAKLKRKKSEAPTEADAQSTRESRAASEAQSNAGDATDAESQAGDRDRAESQAGDNGSQAGDNASQAGDGAESQAGDNASQNEYQVDGKQNGGGLKGGRKGRGADDESAAGDSVAGDSATGGADETDNGGDATDNGGDETDNGGDGDAPLEEDYNGDEVEDGSEFDPDEARKQEEEEMLEQQEREEKEDEEDEMNLFEEDEESEDDDDDSDEEDDEAKQEQDKINSLKQIPATLAKGFLGFLCGGSEQPAAQEGENERFLRKAKNKARTKGLDQKQFEQKLKEYANKTGAAMQGTVAARKQNEADLAEAIRRAQKTEKIRKRRERRKREKQRQANMLNEMTKREAGPGQETASVAPAFSTAGSGSMPTTPRSRGMSMGRGASFNRGMSRMSMGLGGTAANLMRQGSRMSMGGYSAGFGPGPEAPMAAPAAQGQVMPIKGYEPATGPSGGDSKGTLVTLSYPARIAEMVRQVITRPLIVVTEEQLKQGYVRAQSAHEFARIRKFIGNNLRKTGRVLPARELQIPLTTHIICVFGAFVLTIIPLAGNIFGFVGYICAIKEGGVGFTFAKVYILMGYYLPHWIIVAISLLLTFSLWVVKSYCYPATPNGPHQVEVCFRRLVWYPACLAGSYILPSMHAWFLHQHNTIYDDSEVMYAATFNMLSFCAMAFLFAIGLLVVETYVGKRDRNIVKGDPLVAKPTPKEETNLEEMPINLRRLLSRDRFWLLMNSIEERKDTVLGEFCPRCQAHSHRLVLHRKADAYLAMQQLEWEQQEKERLEALEREQDDNDINDYMDAPQAVEPPPLNFDALGSSQLSFGQQSQQSGGSNA